MGAQFCFLGSLRDHEATWFPFCIALDLGKIVVARLEWRNFLQANHKFLFRVTPLPTHGESKIRHARAGVFKPLAAKALGIPRESV